MDNNIKLVGKIFSTGVMSFCGVVSETAMNVTFPTLMHEFGIGTSTVQWITTGYLLVLALVITMSSYLKRNCSQRTLFLIAIGCFIGATVACFVAPNFATLMIGRMVQGIGTGIALPLMFNIILGEAPQEKIGTFMGVGMLITAVAPAVGPVLGGFIVDSFGWRYIFLSLLPLLLLSLIIGCRLIKHSAPTERSRFHFFDYLLIVVGYSTFILAMVQASSAGWVSTVVISLLVVAVAAMVWFVRQAKRESHPLLRVEVLSHRRYMLTLAAILIAQFAVLALGYAIPNYSQLVNHTKAFTAGFLLVPGCVVGAVVSPLSGRLLDKVGARLPIVAGFGFMFVSTALFAWFGNCLTTEMFFSIYVIYTIGQGLGCGNALTFALSQLPKDLSADGNALVNSFQQLAGAMGTAVVSTIVASQQRVADASNFADATAAGSQNAFITLSVMMFVALAICCVVTKKRAQ
jgi:MFS transporter, DHA2 family, lincomycin resistance protein